MAKSGVIPENGAELDTPMIQNDASAENELRSTPYEPSLKEKESVENLILSAEQKITRAGNTLEKELQKCAR